MANDYSGRIWKITGNDTTPFGTLNVKVKSGIWTGMAAAETLTITDVAGRSYVWTANANAEPVSFYELGWLSGPITFTFSGSGAGELNLSIAK